MGAVFTIVLTLFLVRELGPTDYGVLALAVSVGAIVLIASDLGISQSMSRFAAEKPRDRMHAAAVLRTALDLKLIASAVATVALILLAPVIADAYDTPSLTLPLRLIAIAVAVQGIAGIFQFWFTALGRVSLNLWTGLVKSSVEATASIGLVLLGAGAAGAVGGRAIGWATAGILAAALALRVTGWKALRDAGSRQFPARRIAGYGAAMLVINGVMAIFERVDVLIIGAMLDTASAGLFEAAARILTFLVYPAIAVATGFTPRLARGSRSQADSARFIAAFRYTVLLYLLLAAPVLVWAEPIVRLVLGDEYSDSAPVLRALAPTVVLFGLATVLQTAANYLGEARRRIPLAIGALLVNVVIDLVLVPPIGIVAGAIGTGAAMTLYTGGHAWICQRALETPFSGLAIIVGRGLIAAAVAALVLLAAGTHHLSAFAWIAGSVAATFAYLAVLLLLRELSIGELRSLVRRLRLPFSRESSPPGAG